MTVNVYLTFEDNCQEAFDYYKSIFGGEYQSISKFSEMPPSDEYPVAEEDKNKIMHVTLPVGEGTILMGSDTASNFGPPLVVGNNFSISVSPDSREEADRIFGALANGGSITMEMQDTFWESYFGMCKDKFGIGWMVNFSKAG